MPPPTGTVTFLFTDIEGSTRLLQELAERYDSLLETHHAILRGAIADHRGIEVSTEGDAFFAVFTSALDAVRAAAAAQRSLEAAEFPSGAAVRVRMGLHTGEGRLGGDDYVGLDVHRAARIAAAANGGQVLLSGPTSALIEMAPPEGIGLRDLGRHRLKDLVEAEHLSQLVIEGLAAEFPAPRTLDARRTNLTPPVTPFVGRDRELSEVQALLDGTRLLSLTGPGGTGKTRLAIELGERVLTRYGDGVFLVPLESITSPALVTASVAQTLGARTPTQQEPEQALIEHLSGQELLLILDNFEQVIDAAPLVSRLLSGAPRLRMAVTSRVPLHVSGEQEYAVPPMRVPDPELSGIEALSRVEAVMLFVERARRVRPGFALADQNAAAVAAICRRLDGLPLAIELAAARVKLLQPAAMLSRLEHSLSLLAGTSPDLPPRQRTLRGAIEWSHQLLSEQERVLFRRLSIFRGGWTLEAAEAVALPDGDLDVDLFDGLSALVDQSLVRTVDDDPSGEPRFEMLQLIREYGAERLAESDDAEPVGRRHAEWVLSLVEAGAPSVEEGRDLSWLDRFAREHDNLRAALDWTVRQGRHEIGLRLASAAWRFWQQRGHVREGRDWLDRLLPSGDAEPGIDPDVLAAAHTAAGGLAYWQSALPEAEEHYQLALAAVRRSARSDRLGEALYNLAFVAMARGDLETARGMFADSAEAFVAAGHHGRLGEVMGARGAVELRAGNLEAARDWMEEGRRLNLERGNRPRATDNVMVLSNIYFRLGESATAHDRLLTAVRESRAMGDVGRWPLILEMGTALALSDERPRDALLLASAAARRRVAQGGGVPNFIMDVEQVVADAREAVARRHGEEETAAAWAEGQQIDDDAIVEFLER